MLGILFETQRET